MNLLVLFARVTLLCSTFCHCFRYTKQKDAGELHPRTAVSFKTSSLVQLANNHSVAHAKEGEEHGRKVEEEKEEAETTDVLALVFAGIFSNLFHQKQEGDEEPYSNIRIRRGQIRKHAFCPNNDACVDLYIADEANDVQIPCAQLRTVPVEKKAAKNMTADELQADYMAEVARDSSHGFFDMAGQWVVDTFEGVSEVLLRARLTLQVRINQVTWKGLLWTCGTLPITVVIPGSVLRVEKGHSSLVSEAEWQIDIHTLGLDVTGCPSKFNALKAATDIVQGLNLKKVIGGVLVGVLKNPIKDAITGAIEPWTNSIAIRTALAAGRAGNGFILSGTDWTC